MYGNFFICPLVKMDDIFEIHDFVLHLNADNDVRQQPATKRNNRPRQDPLVQLNDTEFKRIFRLYNRTSLCLNGQKSCEKDEEK
jgi:hypothetical protein